MFTTVELTASLEASNPDLLKVLKKLPKGSLLSTGNLRALGLLLLEDRATIQMGVRVYLESIGGDEKMRKKVRLLFVEQEQRFEKPSETSIWI